MSNRSPAAAINRAKSSRGAWFADHLVRSLSAAMAYSVAAMVAIIGWALWHGSHLTREKFGIGFLTSSSWDPVHLRYGAAPFLFGTLVSSLIALLLAVPLSLGSAIYLTELAPRRIRQPLVSLIEMLASIPSVILGLWGMLVMVPFLRPGPYAWLEDHLGSDPEPGSRLSTMESFWYWVKDHLGITALFAGPNYGVSMLSGGIIIAIMILPIITSISREMLRSVPNLQREAAYALGATRWEVTRIAVLSYARTGLIGAVILGLGRALGETMAVTMVIGNACRISSSILSPGDTLASVIANQFSEASLGIQLSALFELGLILFGVTIVVNLIAQLLLKQLGGATPSQAA